MRMSTKNMFLLQVHWEKVEMSKKKKMFLPKACGSGGIIGNWYIHMLISY